MRVQEGPIIGGLRIVGIYRNQIGDGGSIMLQPDNDMVGVLHRNIATTAMLARMNIGDRILMEAPEKWFSSESEGLA